MLHVFLLSIHAGDILVDNIFVRSIIGSGFENVQFEGRSLEIRRLTEAGRKGLKLQHLRERKQLLSSLFSRSSICDQVILQLLKHLACTQMPIRLDR